MPDPAADLTTALQALIDTKPSLGVTATTAKRGDWKPSIDDITGLSTIGRALLTAPDKETARAIIDAAEAGATTPPDPEPEPEPEPGRTVARPLGTFTIPREGLPPNPGRGTIVLSPNPSPCVTPEALTGPRIRISQNDNPEQLNGMILAPGTVVEFQRGATWPNVRVRIRSTGTTPNPVLIASYGDWNAPAPTFKATKPGTFKDDGIFAVVGPNVHIRDLRFANSGSVGINVYPEGVATIIHNVAFDDVVIGVWVRGNWTKIWNCYARNGRMMPDTPGPFDDYGATGVVCEAHDLMVQGFTGHNLHASSPDYDQWGGDGAYAEVWMRGDRYENCYGYMWKSPRLLEAGGLGTNSARNMKFHHIYCDEIADTPIYFNPEGPYSGMDTSGFQQYENVVNGSRL